ncbi:MAG: S41 family peptidase [Candidatus Obscuribacterales bacterium]|nr:S41 family peptidase [Candidatus Obscuribacterales bacterium]
MIKTKLPRLVSMTMAFVMMLLTACVSPSLAGSLAPSDLSCPAKTLPNFDDVQAPSGNTIWLPKYNMTERGKAAEKSATLIQKIKRLFAHQQKSATKNAGGRGVEYKLIDWEGHKYAWVRINDLEYRDVDYDFERAVNDMDRQGAEGFAIDIRNIRYANDFDKSIYCSHVLLPDGTLSDVNARVDRDDIAQNFKLFGNGMAVTTYNYQTKERNTEYYRRGREEGRKKPMMFLADRYTTQGAEIFLAAVRENKRGKIVGERTYGDGRTAYYVRKKDDRGDRIVRADAAEFYNPAGKCIGSDYRRCSNGIDPDFPVQGTNNTSEFGDTERDPALREALTRLKEQSTRGK